MEFRIVKIGLEGFELVIRTLNNCIVDIPKYSDRKPIFGTSEDAAEFPRTILDFEET
jgi:hypothetical protein